MKNSGKARTDRRIPTAEAARAGDRDRWRARLATRRLLSQGIGCYGGGRIMAKTHEEIAAEILAAALASGQLTTTGKSTTLQADEIATAFRRIREAVASPLPPGP